MVLGRLELCGLGLCDSIAPGHSRRLCRELLCACLGRAALSDRLGVDSVEGGVEG